MNRLSLNNAPKASGRCPDYIEPQPPSPPPQPAPPPRRFTGATTPLATALAAALAASQSKETKTMNTKTTTKPAPKALLTATGRLYLGVALAKGGDDLHPNFERALKLKPKQLAVQLRVHRAIARALSQSKDVRQITILTLKELKDDAQCYVTALKGLAADAAFAAHMDVNTMRRAMNPDAVDEALDAMGDAHPVTDDLPVFDHAAHRELNPELDEGANSVPIETIASSVEDAYEAIAGVQEFLTLATLGLDENQRSYWGLETLVPLGQSVKKDTYGEKVYTPLYSFDDYRDWQAESWRIKSRTVRSTENIEELMSNA